MRADNIKAHRKIDNPKRKASHLKAMKDCYERKPTISKVAVMNDDFKEADIQLFIK